jgi:hypothetical protein
MPNRGRGLQGPARGVVFFEGGKGQKRSGRRFLPCDESRPRVVLVQGPPGLVVGRKHPVIPVPVLPRRRTRSVSAARSAWLIGRPGRNTGEASHPAPSAAGTKTPSVAHTCRCT